MGNASSYHYSEKAVRKRIMAVIHKVQVFCCKGAETMQRAQSVASSRLADKTAASISWRTLI